MLRSAVGVRWRCAFIKENSLTSSPFLRFDDLAAVLAMTACERAAGAIATAVTELTESGAATDQMTGVLLKHFLVHFSSLENDFEQLIQPMSFEDADLAPARSEQP
jgi:hypothetical protein